MDKNIVKLEPHSVWNFFYQLTQIPRPSKKEDRVSQFVANFGRDNGLETIVDEVGNVILRKAAYQGYEKSKMITLQGHLDMVPQKNGDKIHDFEKDPIEAYIDGEWVTANGTTLGADNGIGVAIILAILADKSLACGPIEALFTIDEETGMTGVEMLQPNVLKGEVLINLDSEEEGILTVGCAGGINVNIEKCYIEENAPINSVAYVFEAKGMNGGHSGTDINLERANANRIAFRFLYQAEKLCNIRIAEYVGGDIRNAIPREAKATIVVPKAKSAQFEALVAEYDSIFKAEYIDTDKEITVFAYPTNMPEKVMSLADQSALIRAVSVCPNGVQRMSRAVEGLVETSNNLAVVKIGNGTFESKNLTRSSVESAKMATANTIAALYELVGATVVFEGGYPGWKPNINSEILKVMSQVYNQLFGIVPAISAIHAGLECGLLGSKYPNMDMISVGPTLLYPHSPDEKVNIASVEKYYRFIQEVLKYYTSL